MQIASASLNKNEIVRFKEWLLSKEKVGHFFDPTMKRWLWEVDTRIKKDYDHFMTICGMEGDGKTTLGTQICAHMDDDFCLDKVCFSKEEFVDAIKKYHSNFAVMLDEGGQMLFSREAMREGNIFLNKLFMIMRKRRIFCCICLPNFHVLDSYIRLHRVKTLIQIRQRGKYTGIIEDGIKKVVKEGQKDKRVLGIKLPTSCFWRGDFNKDFPPCINQEEYEEKKDRHIQDFLDNVEESSLFQNKERIWYPASKVAVEMGINKGTMLKWCVEGKKNIKKIGGMYYIHKNEYMDMKKSKSP